MSKRNFRFRLCKVVSVFPSEQINRIRFSNEIHESRLMGHIDDSELEICKHSDDNTALIQKQIDSFRSYIEKSFILNFVELSLVILILILS